MEKVLGKLAEVLAEELAVWKGLKPNTYPETLWHSSDSASSHSSLLCLDALSLLVGSTAASLSVDTGHCHANTGFPKLALRS